MSRSLRGNVDRNLLTGTLNSEETVVPYVGTWIEIRSSLLSICGSSVVPYVGTWIEIMLLTEGWDCPSVVPYVGTWIEIPVSD